MALLDVSEIVLDPDFADAIVCKRRSQTIGTNGRATNAAPVETTFYGVVTEYDGDILERMEIGDKIKGSITIHSKFPLIEGAPGQTADIIAFRGREYTVARVENYSHFGAGFTAARCDLLPLSG